MEFFINIALKSTLILLGSGLILLSLKRTSATLRHWVISLTMIGLLVLPVLTQMLPTVSVEVPEYVMAPKIIAEGQSIAKPLSGSIIQSEAAKEVTAKEPTSISEMIKSIESPNAELSQNSGLNMKDQTATLTLPTFSWSKILLLLWGIGILFFLLKFGLGLYQIHQITTNSLPYQLPVTLQNFVEKQGGKRVTFLVSEVIKTPMTWGGW
ncbi:MAG: hypothetical protein AAGJ18_22670, partial [Bacteroidota bacterium]